MTATITYRKTGAKEIMTLDPSDGNALKVRTDGAIVIETKTGIAVFSKDFVKKIELSFE